ncbi:glycosyl hydrolase family 28-related protein [Tuwongella immobilis]|nr:glycosyl hydrolase family 28-related protein [Tuwongella immobilis]
MTVASGQAAETYLTGVTVTASSEQVKGYTGAANLVNDRGFREVPPGSGNWLLTNNGSADGGCMWNSAYLPSGPQETPLLDFDLGRSQTVAAMHVWNHNSNLSRNFRNVTVYYSADGKRWQTHPQSLIFRQASGKPDDPGERYPFQPPITARYIRLWAESTYRSGGQPDVAALGKVRFLPGKPSESAPVAAAAGLYPPDAGVVSVKDAPYLAKGDGVTDDTAAIRRAIADTQGTRKMLYLPAGTYLVSDSLAWRKAFAYGHQQFRGESMETTIIRLKDRSFSDPKSPQAVIDNGFNGEYGKGSSADWFHNHFTDFTVDTGRNNPGAVGVRFYSNNLGRLGRVRIRSGDGDGVIGLDMGHTDMNGPLLVKDVEIDGFDTGIRCGGTVNSQTLERIRLSGQRVIGLTNHGQCLSIRDLESRNACPVLESKFGVLALVDFRCIGESGAESLTAISTNETLFARNLQASGYDRVLKHVAKETTWNEKRNQIDEYVSAKPMKLHGAEPRSLNLPVKETPTPLQDALRSWANVRAFRAISDLDDSAALQRAADSGAGTLYFPPGTYVISQNVTIPATVHRMCGMFSTLRAVQVDRKNPREFHIEIADGERPIFVEDFLGDVEWQTRGKRTWVLRNCGLSGGSATATGEMYLENVVGDWIFGKGQRVWARQFNAEREGVHMTNAGGSLWILGLKTERGGVLIDTLQGGQTEVIGGLSYTTTNGKLGPMFRVTDGRLSVTLGEVCYTGDPYRVLIESIRNGEIYRIPRGEPGLRPGFLHGSALPLVVVGPAER